MYNIFKNIYFIFLCVLYSASAGKENIETQHATFSDSLVGFESKYPQSEWDVKRQTARFVGKEPALFLDDTFILASRNLARSLHPFQKRSAPLSFLMSNDLMKSITVKSIVPAPDGHGFFAYCLGSYKDKSLFLLFRTMDGIVFNPIDIDQIPSKTIWDDLPSNERPDHNNVLNLNFNNFGEKFSAYYSTFFKVKESYPYRAIIITTKPRPRKAMIIQSLDGISWEPMPHQFLRTVPYETNKPTYDPFHDRYLGYLRLWDPHNGPVSRWRKVIFSQAFVTPDSIIWTEDELILSADEGDGPSTDIYYMQVTGYAGQYIGIPTMYHRPSALDVGSVGKLDCELAYSHDGRNWNRICQGQHTLPTGTAGSWDAGMVGISTNPVIFNDSLYYYYWGTTRTHDEPAGPDYHVDAGLASLRVDGFVSMDAGDEPGTLVTTPFWPTGKYLYINADATEGEIRVEVLQDYYYVELRKIEKNPEQVKGLFRAENCIPFVGDEIAHRVEWINGENFVDDFPGDWNRFLPEQKKKRSFSKRAVALKFYIKNAKLYSFWFADEKLPVEKGRLVPFE